MDTEAMVVELVRLNKNLERLLTMEDQLFKLADTLTDLRSMMADYLGWKVS